MRHFGIASILVIILLGFEASAAPVYHVIVDPGHGGTDSGAVAKNLKESDVVLNVSKELSRLLKLSSRFKVSMTRDRNKNVGLMERSRFAGRMKGDIFVSIHANSSPAQSAHGTEFYLQSSLPADEESMFLANRENEIDSDLPTSIEDQTLPKTLKGDVVAIVSDLFRHTHAGQSMELAQILKDAWKSIYPDAKCEIREGPFHVLVQTPMPSILIEIGYITNVREAQLLTDTQYQNQIAEIIFRALQKFSETLDKEQVPSHISAHASRR